MAMVGGTITRVDTQLDFLERASSVTGLSDGGRVVTWESENTPTGRTDVYQQAFNATGTRNGGETWIDGSMNGNDTMCGGEGNDSLSGGDENDQAYDGKGSDSLSGGRGRDTMGGGEGTDRLFGGQGADILAGAGRDVLAGGKGRMCSCSPPRAIPAPMPGYGTRSPTSARREATRSTSAGSVSTTATGKTRSSPSSERGLHRQGRGTALRDQGRQDDGPQRSRRRWGWGWGWGWGCLDPARRNNQPQGNRLHSVTAGGGRHARAGRNASDLLPAGMGTRKTEGFREGRDGAHVRQHVSRLRNHPLFEAGDEPIHQQPSRIGPGEDGVERAGPVEISIRNQGPSRRVAQDASTAARVRPGSARSGIGHR